VIDNGYPFDHVHSLMVEAAAGKDVKEGFDKLLKLEKDASHRYLSEDYMFCQYWRNIGGTIYLCPWMKTAHIGTYHFQGDMPSVANFVGEM
jgi:hypothetical protein